MITDTERLDWIQRTGANVIGLTDDGLRVMSFSVCVNRVTEWTSADSVREAIDDCMASENRETKQ